MKPETRILFLIILIAFMSLAVGYYAGRDAQVQEDKATVLEALK